MKRYLLTIATGLVFLVGCSSEDYAVEANSKDQEAIVTTATFEKLENGMTPKEVYEVLDGYPYSIVETDGDLIFLYNGTNDSLVDLGFKNDELNRKHETGLTETRSSEAAITNSKTKTSSTDNSDEGKSEEVQKESDSSIPEDALEHAYEVILEYEEVSDAYIQVDDDQINMTIIVPASMNEETAQGHIDSFVRALASGASIYGNYEGPTNDNLGSLYDDYKLHVGAGSSSDNIITQGAKVTSANKITY